MMPITVIESELSDAINQRIRGLEIRFPNFHIIPTGVEMMDVTHMESPKPECIFQVKVKLLQWDKDGQMWEATEK